MAGSSKHRPQLSEIGSGEFELTKVSSNCIAITNANHCSNWLYGLNDSASNLIFVEPGDGGRIASLLDTVDIDFALVHLVSQDREFPAADKPQAFRQELALIENLIDSKPTLAVIAMVETLEQDIVLPIIRSGARDIIQIGTPSHEVQAVIKRHHRRSSRPILQPQLETGHVYTLLNARIGDGNSLFSMHMALELQQHGSTLLLDLGSPNADIMLIMGLTAKFSLLDVIQNRIRLDADLIEGGFARHASGLSLLSMPEDTLRYSQLSPTDLSLVLHALKRHFDYIFINLAGVIDTELLRATLAASSATFMLVEQTIPSCKRNLDLLESLRQLKIAVPDGRLVVDRLMDKISPSADDIAESFGMPLAGTLPGAGDLRLRCINGGESMFDKAPHGSYATTIRRLVDDLPGTRPRAYPRRPISLWTRLKIVINQFFRSR